MFSVWRSLFPAVSTPKILIPILITGLATQYIVISEQRLPGRGARRTMANAISLNRGG